MRGWMTSGRIPVLGLGLALVLAGCEAVDTSAPEEQVEAAEARLRSPYEQERAVMSEELLIDITANFYSDVGRPAVQSQLHELKRTEEDGIDIYRWTSTGGIQNPLTFTIGKTRFVALQSATLRVRGRGEYAFNTTAAGNVTVSEAGQLQNCREVRVAEGMFSRL